MAQGDCIVLAEANVLPETDMEYFGADGDRMHMMFNFQVNQHLFYALATADARPLITAMKATKPRCGKSHSPGSSIRTSTPDRFGGAASVRRACRRSS